MQPGRNARAGMPLPDVAGVVDSQAITCSLAVHPRLLFDSYQALPHGQPTSAKQQYPR